MNTADIERLKTQGHISVAYTKSTAIIAAHLDVVEELRQIIEFECSKDPLADGPHAPDVKEIKHIALAIQRTTENLISLYSTS